MNTRSAWIAAGVWLVASAALAADTYQDHATIVAAARGFLADQTRSDSGETTVAAGALDPRLRLAACDGALEAFLPPGSQALGATTVGVRCRGNQGWIVYVPVTVKAVREVVVITRALAARSQIGPEDIKVERRELSAFGGTYLTDPAQAAGKLLRRPVIPGTALTADMLEAARLVKRGERVSIVAAARGMEVRGQGEAMADGAAGELIRVRSLPSKRIIEAVVTASGVVRVRM